MSVRIQIVRSLTPDQVEILDEYLKEAIQQGEWLTRVQYRYKPQYAKIAKFLNAGHGVMAIAYDNTIIVGSICANFPMLPVYRHTAKFRKLLVIPPYRGQGIARQLLQEIENAVRAKGKTTVWFNYHRSNPAKTLYEALSYKVIGYADPWHNWIRVEKRLS